MTTETNPAERYTALLKPSQSGGATTHNGKKTLLLWIFLVLFFVAVYRVLTPPGERVSRYGRAAEETPVEQPASSFAPPRDAPTRVGLLFIAPGLAALMLFLGRRQLRNSEAETDRHQRAQDAVLRGAWDEALERMRGASSDAVLSFYELAHVAEARADFPALLVLSERGADVIKKVSPQHRSAYAMLAHPLEADRVAALVALGRVNEAQIHAKGDGLQHPCATARGRALLVRALVHSAAGERDAFHSFWREHRAELEATLTAPQRALAAVLVAHASGHAPVAVPSEVRAWVLASAPHASAFVAAEEGVPS